MSNARVILLILVNLGLSTLILGCGKEDQASARPRPATAAPVLVATVQKRDMPLQIRAIASVEAFSMVTVRSRVAGELQKVHITPGQDVHSDDLLFEIDPRPFEAELHDVEAQLERDRALSRSKQIDSDRLTKLAKDNVATREEADKARFESEAAMATIRADEAKAESARLRLAYTKIRSPIDGRAGELMTHQGNVVKVDDTALLAIHRIQPIYVTFSIPEQDLDQVRKRMQSGQPPQLSAIIPPDDQPGETGTLSFIDNQVDSQTGTIRLKGTFANESRRLWPGQFVQAILNLTVDADATVIPTRALQTGQQGAFVFVIRDDLTAEVRPVKSKRTVGEDTIIESGLVPGERIVTEGQLRLAPGTKVQIKGPATAPTTQLGVAT